MVFLAVLLTEEIYGHRLSDLNPNLALVTCVYKDQHGKNMVSHEKMEGIDLNEG